MDKDEYRAYRDTMFRRARQEEERKKASERISPYSDWKMRIRMPLGCWIWIIGLGILAFMGIAKLLH